MTAPSSQEPLSNLQLELLKLYSKGITEEELLDIRRMLARYFMERAISGATKIWKDKGYSSESLVNEPS